MSAEADAVASMLQLASNTQEQLPQQSKDRDVAQAHEDDVEMDNPTESSLSELEDRAGSDVEDLEDDDLSDPGDEEEEDEENEGDGAEDRDDEEARIGEADTVDDEGEDTEAETERLDDSPDKLRTSRSVHHRAEDQLQLPDDNIDQTSEISALSDSPTGDMSPLESSPRKRKRDSVDTGDEDEDDTGQSLRQVSRKLEGRTAEDEEEAEEPDDRIGQAGLHNTKDEEEAGSGDERLSSKENTPDGDTLTKATSKDDAEASGDEDGEGDAEETGADMEAKGEEDTVKKETALSSLRIMEKDFARLRDEMFASRMQQLNQELEQLQHDPMTHPEYAAAMDAIDRRRDEQVRQARATLDYKIKSLQKRSVAERAMAHSQYVQEVAQIRDACLEQAGNEWYRIQKARRQGDDSEFEQRYHYDMERSKQIARQTSYNTEVSILSGVQKYVGFPAAPTLDGVGIQEAEEDLRKMGIMPKPKHNLPVAAPLSSFPRQVQPAADEHFLKNNLWADPQNAYQAHAQLLPPSAQQYSTPAVARRQEAPQGSASTIAAASSVEQTPMSGQAQARFVPQLDGAGDTPSRIPASNGVVKSGINGTTHGSPHSSPLKAPQSGIPLQSGGS